MWFWLAPIFKTFPVLGLHEFSGYKWFQGKIQQCILISKILQCTIANDIQSDYESITCGVPQGSVCGPLLFLLYINDISRCPTKCKVSLYADDTVLYYCSENLEEAQMAIQDDLILLMNGAI